MGLSSASASATMSMVGFLLILAGLLLSCSGSALLAAALAADSSSSALGHDGPRLVWNMHAASLYQLHPSAENAIVSDASALSPGEGQLLTTKCILNDLSDLVDATYATRSFTRASSGGFAGFSASEQVIPLYEHLWGVSSGRDRWEAAFPNGPSLSTGAIVAGKLSFGPFQAEVVQASPEVTGGMPGGGGKDESDESDEPFLLSIFLGESTEKLCYDISVYRRREDVGVLTKAIMTWTSSSYTSSCQMRLSAYMEGVLNLTTPNYYYRSRNPNAAAYPASELSPWLGACKLSTVDRYDFAFVPSDILARDSFCHYVDEDAAKPLVAGERRRVECAVVLAVQFRPWTSTVTEEERHRALLKIAAGLTLAPVTKSSGEIQSNETEMTLRLNANGDVVDGYARAPGTARAGTVAGGSSADNFSDNREEHAAEAVSARTENGRSSSLASGTGSDDAEVSWPTAHLQPVSALERILLFPSQPARRCSDLSIPASFWNISGSVCKPLVDIIPDTAVGHEVNPGSDWDTIVILVLSNIFSAVLAFLGVRFAVIHMVRRARYYES